ncbi:MAG: hypothetical protein QM778_20390 [Myxococcales bacterium]
MRANAACLVTLSAGMPVKGDAAAVITLVAVASLVCAAITSRKEFWYSVRDKRRSGSEPRASLLHSKLREWEEPPTPFAPPGPVPSPWSPPIPLVSVPRPGPSEPAGPSGDPPVHAPQNKAVRPRTLDVCLNVLCAIDPVSNSGVP